MGCEANVATASHPFQKICYLKELEIRSEILLAVSGPYIFSFSLKSGDLLSRWPAENDKDEEFSGDESDYSDGKGEPISKRRKRSAGSDGRISRKSSAESVEIVSERVKGKRRRPKLVSNKLPDISHLLALSDGRHVVAITTEDKCVRVIEADSDGKLKNVSERCMPKRLCAITLTQDEAMIVAGDKFGDVYCLPLFAPKYQPHSSPTPEVLSSKPVFEPSATELTVHTKGNLEALKQQKLQRNFKPKKEAPSFQHQLLLGHVSLLTDLAVAEIKHKSSHRQYILTSDRDEHIRISRGLSQAHIIENYCLGHKDFVSKLCIMPWDQTILVTGSGEPSLKVYDWQKGECITDMLFTSTVREDVESCLSDIKDERSLEKLAVSGIWPVEKRLDGSDDAGSELGGYLLVAIEGLPLLLSYLYFGKTFIHKETLNFPGNVLDVAVLPNKQTIIVSIDTVHESGSMRLRRTSPLKQADGLCCVEMKTDTPAGSPDDRLDEAGQMTKELRWRHSDLLSRVLEMLGAEGTLSPLEVGNEVRSQRTNPTYSKLGEFLYGLENLRKKRGQEAANGEDIEDDAAIQIEGEVAD